MPTIFLLHYLTISTCHIHILILARTWTTRLPHLQLQLRARIPIHRHAMTPRRREPIRTGTTTAPTRTSAINKQLLFLTIRQASRRAIISRVIGSGSCGCRPGHGGLVAAEPGARGGGLAFDLLVGGGFGDYVFEEFEVVVVGDGGCFGGLDIHTRVGDTQE